MASRIMAPKAPALVRVDTRRRHSRASPASVLQQARGPERPPRQRGLTRATELDHEPTPGRARTRETRAHIRRLEPAPAPTARAAGARPAEEQWRRKYRAHGRSSRAAALPRRASPERNCRPGESSRSCRRAGGVRVRRPSPMGEANDGPACPPREVTDFQGPPDSLTAIAAQQRRDCVCTQQDG